MHKRRRHERVRLLADLIIQPGDKDPARFSGKVFNISRSGAAVHSQRYFPPGKVAGVELFVPVAGGPARRGVDQVMDRMLVVPAFDFDGKDIDQRLTDWIDCRDVAVLPVRIAAPLAARRRPRATPGRPPEDVVAPPAGPPEA